MSSNLARAVVDEQERRSYARYRQSQRHQEECIGFSCTVLAVVAAVISLIMIPVSMGLMLDLRLNSNHCLATGLTVPVQREDSPGYWSTHYRHQLTTHSGFGFNCTMEDSDPTVQKTPFRCSSNFETRQCDEVESDIDAWTVVFGIFAGAWAVVACVLGVFQCIKSKFESTPKSRDAPPSQAQHRMEMRV